MGREGRDDCLEIWFNIQFSAVSPSASKTQEGQKSTALIMLDNLAFFLNARSHIFFSN